MAVSLINNMPALFRFALTIVAVKNQYLFTSRLPEREKIIEAE